jgi:hypothetical protein
VVERSKSQQWTTIAQSGFSSKTEPTSDSMLSRSFASHPIFPTGKLTTIDESNAGHLCTANNPDPPKGGFLTYYQIDKYEFTIRVLKRERLLNFSCIFCEIRESNANSQWAV